jgi:hypothetical protein
MICLCGYACEDWEGEKELIKERFLKALNQVKEKIEQAISEVESKEI